MLPAVRSEHLSLGACALGLAVGLGVAIPTARGDAKSPTIGVDEIKEGMKGYGLTVFKGTEPERFDVEVIGVLHNFRPGQELILVKTPHPRLNITKNVKGMSGSPIYLDGRLAGAYAYSWASFQVEPVAGVTPIAPMLAEMRRPIPAGFWPLEGAAPLPRAHGASSETAPRHAMNDGAPSGNATPNSTTAYDGTPGEYDLEAHAAQVASRMGMRPDPTRPLVAAGTPLMLSGMGDRAAALARKLFEPLGMEPLQTGGGSAKVTADTPQHYVDGGAVGVQFVSGDVSMMGLGTVTHVEGTKLCGFGHPMMGMGDTALPAVIGRVHWIFASDQHSSKIGEAARALGALVQDRQSSIVVDEKAVPPMFPLTVDIKGAEGSPKSKWAMDVAEEKFMTSGLVAASLGSVVEATVSERRDVTWRMVSKLSVRGHGTIELEDFGVAIGGTPDQDEWARSRIVRIVGDVLNNPWELPRIEKIQSTLSVQYTRDLVRLRGVELLDPVVDAGERARIKLHLVPLAGPEVTRVMEVVLPKELAGKDVEIELIPGYEVSPEVAAPESLTDLLVNATKQTTLPRSMVAQIKLASLGVSYKGHVAKRLPGFALDALRPASNDIGPDPFISYLRTELPLDRYVDGHGKVKVKVRAPVR